MLGSLVPGALDLVVLVFLHKWIELFDSASCLLFSAWLQIALELTALQMLVTVGG